MMLAKRYMPELTDQQLQRWQILLEAQTGINLGQHRHILKEGLNNWMTLLGESDSERYLSEQERKPWAGLGQSLVDFLAVKDTRFYRNPDAYRVLSRFLIKRLQETGQRNFDIWSAGCATGEEVFTLAMVANEIISKSGREAYFGIIGSDISSAALKVAKLAHYSARSLTQLPGGLRDKYLKAVNGGLYEVDEALRKRVCFVQSNLLDRQCAPTSAMDIIFCHNVLIYFKSWRQKEVLNNLVARLKPEGILVIGPGESSGWSHPEVRRIIDGKVQVFMRQHDNNINRVE